MAMFFPKSFTVLALTFGSLTNLNFCIWCEERIQVSSFPCGYHFFQHRLSKSLFFPPLNYLGTFVKSQLTQNVKASFWPLTSVPLLYIVYLCFWKYSTVLITSFVVSFESESPSLSNLYASCFIALIRTFNATLNGND